MNKSLAAVFSGGPEGLQLQELAIPALDSGELLVRVLACTVCGSDLHSLHGRRKVPVPTVLGHEVVGEIAQTGPGAPVVAMDGRPLQVGERVVWSVVADCGECLYCQRGLPQKCLQRVKYGHEAMRPGRELLGGMARHMLLVRGTRIVRLPEELSLATACPASCATATVAAVLEAAQTGSDDLRGRFVAVLGAGMLGLVACAMARSRGAAEVLCVEPQAERRGLAGRFGATAILEPGGLAAAVAGVNGGAGLDAVLEMAGAVSGLPDAIAALRMGGRLVLAGSVFPGPALTLSPELLVTRQLTIAGIHNYAPRHLCQAVEFLQREAGSYPFDELVSAWYPLESIHEAIASASAPGIIRVGLLSSSD